jgi:hypothetical protein
MKQRPSLTHRKGGLRGLVWFGLVWRVFSLKFEGRVGLCFLGFLSCCSTI